MDEKMLATALRHYCPVPGFFFFVGLSFLGQLFSFLLLHPADEQHTHDDDIGNAHRHPHDESAKLLICGRRNAPYTRRGNVRSVERRGEGETCPQQKKKTTPWEEGQTHPPHRKEGQGLTLCGNKPPIQEYKHEKRAE